LSLHAVLFDLDGTLLDTLDDLADSMNAVLAAAGHPVHPTDAYRRFVGDGVVNLARRALPPDHRDDAAVRRAVEAMRAEYKNRWDTRTRLYDGIPELLDELARRNIPAAVLSNKPHDFTLLCVRKLLARWSFAVVQGVTDDCPPKPDPAAALRVAELLNVTPAEVLYLGDTNTDMATAVAAGMVPVGALWGFRDADELTAAGAALLVTHPREVLELFRT